MGTENASKRNDAPITTAPRQWAARGGPTLLGKVIPGLLLGMSLASLVESVANLIVNGLRNCAGSAFLLAVALLVGYFAWRIFGTTWLVSLADGTFTWSATNRQWLVAPGEIVAIRCEAYDQILQITTMHRRIFIWGQLDDREGLFEAIERANPSVKFSPWIDIAGAR